MKKYLIILLCLVFFTLVGCSHTHSFVKGKCECGEIDPNYHFHSYVDGKCSCGETDPNYIPEHTHNFIDGECSCGEKEPLQNLDSNVEMHTIQYKYDELTKSEYGYIYIGYYPQKEITDSRYLKELKKIDEVNERGYIEYNGYEFAKVVVVNNHIYAEAPQTGDDVFEYGTGYKPGTTHYFLVQPLAWKVLKHNEYTGEIVLQTENIIDTKSFNNTKETKIVNGDKIYPNEYEHSTIREWLNNGFFDICFTDEEKALIQTVINKNEAAYFWDAYAKNDEYRYNDTQDRVYLLSYQEVTSTSFGFAAGHSCDSSRFATASDYANANGLIKHKVTNLEGYTIISSIWMTRTIFEYNTSSISYVGYDGYGYKDFYADAPNVGIRPCITIILE